MQSATMKPKKKWQRMRTESRFVWMPPLTEVLGYVICLFNIRSWKAHIHHFPSDPIYAELCTVLCFTETNLSKRSYEKIKFMPGLDGIHNLTNRGLAIFFDTEKVKIDRKYQVASALEVLQMFIEIDDETVFSFSF